MSETTTQSIPFRQTETSADTSARGADTTSTSKDTSPQYRAGTSGDDPTPYVYQELQKKPYAVKFLDIDLYHADKDFPEVRESAKLLDEYVIKQAKARGLEDKHESYKEVVDAIYKQIGRSANEDPVKSLKRLSIAAQALSRLSEAKLPAVLDAKTLTPDEFEGIQE